MKWGMKEAGVQPGETDDEGCTALILAAGNDHLEVVQVSWAYLYPSANFVASHMCSVAN